MKKYSIELFVGIFVLIGLLCVAYLTIRLGKMDLFNEKGYTLTAKFASTTGLRSGADVEVAGVSIGKVTKIELNPKFESLVHMRIRDGIVLSEDTGASVKTSGLIGDKYISLSPGGLKETLGNNDEITETTGSIDLEALISKYVFGSVK